MECFAFVSTRAARVVTSASYSSGCGRGQLGGQERAVGGWGLSVASIARA